MSKDYSPFIGVRQVTFSDTDASGVAHFAKLLCLVEAVEHDCLRSCGIPVLAEDVGWPRVHVEVDYISSVCAGNELRIELSVAKIGERSLVWQFEAFFEDRSVMKGRYTVVRVGRNKKSTPITEKERECLTSFFSNE